MSELLAINVLRGHILVAPEGGEGGLSELLAINVLRGIYWLPRKGGVENGGYECPGFFFNK